MQVTRDPARQAHYDGTMLNAVRAVNEALIQLDWLINATPSGEVRNKLTDANVFVMQAQAALQETHGAPR